MPTRTYPGLKNIVGLRSFDYIYCTRVSCTRVDKHFSTHLSKKKKSSSTSRIEHKLKRAYKIFVILGNFDALLMHTLAWVIST